MTEAISVVEKIAAYRESHPAAKKLTDTQILSIMTQSGEIKKAENADKGLAIERTTTPVHPTVVTPQQQTETSAEVQPMTKKEAEDTAIETIASNSAQALRTINNIDGGKISTTYNEIKEALHSELAESNVARVAYAQNESAELLRKAQNNELTYEEYCKRKKGVLLDTFPLPNMTDKQKASVAKMVASLSPKETEEFLKKSLALPNPKAKNYKSKVNEFLNDFKMSTTEMISNAQNGDKTGTLKSTTKTKTAYKLSGGKRLMTFDETYKSEMGVTFKKENIEAYNRSAATFAGVSKMTEKQDEIHKQLDNNITIVEGNNRNGVDSQTLETCNKRLEIGLNNSLRKLYGDDEAAISKGLKDLTGENYSFKNGKLTMDVPANSGFAYTANGNDLVRLSKKVLKTVDENYQKTVGKKPLETYAKEMAEANKVAYGMKNAAQLADAYRADQEGVVHTVRAGVEYAGTAVMVAGMLCYPPVAFAGGAIASFGGVGVEMTEEATKRHTDPETMKALGEELATNAALMGIGMGAGKVGATVKATMLAKSSPKLMATIADIGTDASISLMGDLALTGQVNLEGEGFSQIMSLIAGHRGKIVGGVKKIKEKFTKSEFDTQKPTTNNEAKVGENGGTATKTEVSNAPKGMNVEENALLEKATKENPAEVVAEKVKKQWQQTDIDKNAPTEKVDLFNIDTKAGLNEPAPKVKDEVTSLIFTGKLKDALTKHYDELGNVFNDIAKNRSADFKKLAKECGSDKEAFAKGVISILSEEIGMKGFEPKIEMKNLTGVADGQADWTKGTIYINSFENNTKKLVGLISHEYVHMLQYRDILAQYGENGLREVIMNDNNIPKEKKEAQLSEILKSPYTKKLLDNYDNLKHSPENSLNEYITRVYKDEFSNGIDPNNDMKSYTNQVIEREAYHLGSGKLGNNTTQLEGLTLEKEESMKDVLARMRTKLRAGQTFQGSKDNTLTTKSENIVINGDGSITYVNNTPKGIIQPLDVETAASKIKEYVKDDNGYNYKLIMQACTVGDKPNEVLLNKAVSFLEKGIDKYNCEIILNRLKSNRSELDVKALAKFDELTSKGIDPENASETIRDCKDKNDIFSDDLYNKYTSLKSQDYGRRGVLDACIVDGEIVESTWQKALELEKLGLENIDIENVLKACHTKATVDGKTKVTGFSEDLYSKAKTLIVEQKFKAYNAAKIVKACIDEEGKFSQQKFDRAIKYHDKFTERELPDWIRYSDKALDYAHNLQQKYKVDDWDLNWIMNSWHRKEDGRMFLNETCMAKSEELISKYNVDPRDVSMLINASKTDTEFLFTNYNEVVKLYQAGIKRVDDIMEACTTKIDSENSTVNYDLIHKAAEWQKLGIEENYIRIYAQEINQQKIDVTKNDLVTTYHDAKFEPQNIKVLILTNKNLEGITPNEFRDKVLELKKQGYDEDKIINALRQIGASDDWGNPSNKLTKENFDKVVDMFDKGIDDPARIAYMAKENSKLNQEKFNVLYKQAVSGISADRLYYLQNNVEKPEMKDILTDLAKTVNKESNYNDFAIVMQSRSVDVAKASLEALKNGAKESDILELIKFNPSGGGSKFQETIMAKTLAALKEHPEKSNEIREIATHVRVMGGTDEVKTQRLNFYLKYVDKYKEITQSEHPMNLRGQRDYQTSETAIDLMHRLDNAGMPIDEILKTTDLLCKNYFGKNFTPEIIDKVIELHKNKQLDNNLSYFISTVNDIPNATKIIDHVTKLKETKVFDNYSEYDMRRFGNALCYASRYENYKEIADFYIKNKDLFQSKTAPTDLADMIHRYANKPENETFDINGFKALSTIAEKTDIDAQQLSSLITNNYIDKLPGFVEKIDFEKYPNEAKLFLERLSSRYDDLMFSEILNDKITKEDLDFIFDLQKLLNENSKDGSPTILDNRTFSLFTEGEKITPEALDKFRYYVEMELADPKNEGTGRIYTPNILTFIEKYKATPENIDRIENIRFNSGLNDPDYIVSLLSKDKEFANKQLDFIEDVIISLNKSFKESNTMGSILKNMLNGVKTIDDINAKTELWNIIKEKGIVPNARRGLRAEGSKATSMVSMANEKNLAFFKKLLVSEKGITDETYSIAVATNKDNISLVEKIYADNNFPREKVVEVAKATNETNIDVVEKLYADKSFPREDIAKLVKNMNDDNRYFIQKLYADKSFPREDLADIASVAKKGNQNFIETLYSNKNVPKNKIANIAKATIIEDANDAGGNNGKIDPKKEEKYTRLFQNEKVAGWAADMLEQGFDIETISKLAPTKQSFYTEKEVKTETTQNIEQKKDLSPLEQQKQDTIQEFQTLGLDAKQANAVYKSISKNGIVDPDLKTHATELINKGVPKNKIGDILNAAQITGEFNPKIINDFILLQNKGLNPLLEKNLAVLNNISGADCAVKFNSKVRNQMKAMINNMPDFMKADLTEKGIQIDSILNKLNSQIVRTAANVPQKVKVETGLRSKAKITGFEKIVVDKYEPTEEVWRNEEATKKWAEEKYQDFKNREYVSTRNTAEDPELGKKVTEKRKEILDEWYKFMESDENIQKDPFIKVLLCDYITKELEPERSTTPPVLNKEVVKQILGDASNSSNFSFNNAYTKKMKELSAKNSQGQKVEINGRKGTWYTVPKTDSSSPDFKSNAAKIRAFSDGTNWCIRTWNAEPYVQRGAMHFFVDENGLTQICIREDGGAGSIYEIQKRQQNATIPVAYLDVIDSYIKEHDLKPQTTCADRIAKAQEQKPEFDKLKAELTDMNNKKDYKGILKKMGIDVKTLPDGTFQISHYSSYIKEIALADFGINENELLANVSIIKGNADFKDSNVTSLPNLRKVGGLLDFKYANISNIKNLKSINGKEINW